MTELGSPIAEVESYAHRTADHSASFAAFFPDEQEDMEVSPACCVLCHRLQSHAQDRETSITEPVPDLARFQATKSQGVLRSFLSAGCWSLQGTGKMV